MIAYLKGIILSRAKDHIVLLVDHVGYEIFLPITALETIHISEERELFIHDHIREDARDLFGFLELNDLNLFEDLIRVSGVGPKMAMNVLSLGVTRVRSSITQGDVGTLSSVSGVGKKTAQKIVLELKGVLSDNGITSEDTEVIDALRRLGYSQGEARDALKMTTSGTTSEAKIKEALKILGKH